MGKVTPEDALRQILYLAKEGLLDEQPDFEDIFQHIVVWCRKGTLSIDS